MNPLFVLIPSILVGIATAFIDAFLFFRYRKKARALPKTPETFRFLRDKEDLFGFFNLISLILQGGLIAIEVFANSVPSEVYIPYFGCVLLSLVSLPLFIYSTNKKRIAFLSSCNGGQFDQSTKNILGFLAFFAGSIVSLGSGVGLVLRLVLEAAIRSSI